MRMKKTLYILLSALFFFLSCESDMYNELVGDYIVWQGTGAINSGDTITATFPENVQNTDVEANYAVSYSAGASGSNTFTVSYNPGTYTATFTMSLSATNTANTTFRIRTVTTGTSPITDTDGNKLQSSTSNTYTNTIP
ncbi:MAG: hypothetical protein GY754_23525 [bacterium]|nr:hypothetical protein [bacterium]